MKRTLDFIVIGANKAGTTSLFEYMRRHPEVALPRHKEAPFFSRDATYGRGWEQYLAVTLRSADAAQRWGTVTPDYMAGSVFERGDDDQRYDERTVPERIREQLPDVRVVALLRDPVERALSHHKMAVMNNYDQRSFEQAMEELLRPDALERARAYPTYTNSYVVWGEYGRILNGYFALFPHEQILVEFTENMREDPVMVLRQIYGFVGAAEDFVPDNLGAEYRVGFSERRTSVVTPENLQRGLARNPIARSLWHALPTGGRLWIDYHFDAFAYRYDLWNRRPDGYSYMIDADTAARLREHFGADTEVLERLLDVKPPWAS